MLNRQGYITLVVDSFRPRSIISACVAPRGSASYVARSYDAYGALAYLRGRADVDPEQIAVMGWSIGGAAAMNAVAQSGMAQKFEHRFKAAITFYPHCLRARSFDLPMLVMIGDRDEWTPADACRKLQSHLQDQGERPLDLVVYPGAYHAFDEEELKHGFKVPGADGKMHLLLYNKPAHDDSKSRVTDFLRQHLSPG